MLDTDVQAVLTVLIRRRVSHETEPPPWLDLAETNLDRAMLPAARFRRAGLRGANLRGANLSGADVREVWYDDATEWPEGFDPRRAGARFEDSGVEWREDE